MRDFTDILLIIFVILIIIFIGINYIIDKKINNNPQIIIKMQKSCNSDKYDILVENDTLENCPGNFTKIPTENPLSGDTKDKVENFGSILNYTNQLGNTVLNTTSNVVKVMSENIPTLQTKPIEEDLVQESENVNVSNTDQTQRDYIISRPSVINQTPNIPPPPLSLPSIEEKKIHMPLPLHDTFIEKCQNNSLNEQRIDAYKYMIENSKYVNDHNFPIMSNYNGNLIGDNEDKAFFDYLDYYRKYQIYIKAYLEDPIVRGYNLKSYDDSSPIFKSGTINLDNGYKNPKPEGYIFESSPAYKR